MAFPIAKVAYLLCYTIYFLYDISLGALGYALAEEAFGRKTHRGQLLSMLARFT